MSAGAPNKFRNASFDEMEEMALAAELLEVTDEAELDQFLGKLLKKAGRIIGSGLSGPVSASLGGYLKGAVKKALPTIGNYFVPGMGGDIRGRLASQAGKYFGLELEGLSGEDSEYEVARRFVRFAGAAAKAASAGPQSLRQNAERFAQGAVLAAARQHAPGLIRPAGAGACASGNCHCSTCRERQRGSWVRHGREIHLTL